MNGENQFPGVVQDGKFAPIGAGAPERFTTIAMQAALPPESGELDLTPYEGKAGMICGHGGDGGWVYSASVVDEAGPILTAVVYQVFGRTR